MNFIETLYGWEWRGATALCATLLTLIFSLILFPRASGLTGSGENRIVDLQRAYSVEKFRNVLLGWTTAAGARPDAVGVMKRENIIKLDFIFPLLYGAAFAFAFAWARGGVRPPTALDLALFLCPFIAALLDIFENSVHLILLDGVETATDVERANFSAALVLLASLFAHLKYLLLATSLIALLVALVRDRGALIAALAVACVSAAGFIIKGLGKLL
jgi:hypothetical protein